MMLRNSRNQYLQGWQLMPLLGFKRGEHLPATGFVKVVQGVEFTCTPPNGGKHRLRYRCSCGELIPFGRASQHEPSKRHADKVREVARVILER